MLATTTLGGLLAVGGGFLGVWWTERRAADRDRREREHEREVWARGLRYEAHLKFLDVFDTKYRVYMDAEDDRYQVEAPDDWLVPVRNEYQRLRIVSEQWTADLAEALAKALQDYVYGKGNWQQVEWASEQYLGATG